MAATMRRHSQPAAHVIALDEHDTATALMLFNRALQLSNSNVFALSFSAVILAWMGIAELATERAQRALRLSPFDLYNFRANHALAIVHFCSRRYAGELDLAVFKPFADAWREVGLPEE